MKPILYVGNQNYSSWSMRPWLVLRWSAIDFETRAIELTGPGYLKRSVAEVLAVSPSGTVPALQLASGAIGDSLAISEWAAEQVSSLWPRDPFARAQARSAACEMHSSFGALRNTMPCNIRRRTDPRTPAEETARDIARITTIWTTLRERFGAGGDYLFGATPTIPDAFFTPVATRFRTYGVTLSGAAQKYAAALLENEAFQEWERAAIAESWTMPIWDAV